MRLASAVLVLLLCLSAYADVSPCSPVPVEDVYLYDEWGANQTPAVVLESCAERCVRGLRLCRFAVIDDLSAKHMALCNGRQTHEPCRWTR